MKLLDRIGISAQTRLILLIAALVYLALLVSATFVLSFYETYRKDIAHTDLPLLNNIIEANRDLATLQQELLELIEKAKGKKVTEEVIYRQGRQLLDRFDGTVALLPALMHESGSHVLNDETELGQRVQQYRSSMVSAIEMMTVDLSLAERKALTAARHALSFNQEAVRILSLLTSHLDAEGKSLRSSLVALGLPLMCFVLTATLCIFVLIQYISRNVRTTFDSVQQSLLRLRNGNTSLEILPATDSREAKEIALSLEAFRHTLIDLAALRSNLETMVSERTKRLEETNQKLAVHFDMLLATQGELRLFRRVFESTAEAIIITDMDGTIIDVNDAYVQITGFPREEVIGKNPRIARSGRHDAEFYRSMWCDLLERGQWTGEIWDRRHNGEIYPKLLSINAVCDDNQNPTHYVGIFTDISSIKATEEELERLAYYDRLTGLPNRRLLLDRIDHAISRAKRGASFGAIFFLDIDKFKQINDTFGHQAGDQLLVEVARRIKDCVREADTLGRLAGDEFLVLAESLSHEANKAAWQARSIGEKILAALALPYDCGSKAIFSSSSIGIALFDGSLPDSVDDLVTQADTAMYEAKRAGRNTLRFFDRTMQDNLHARMALEQMMRTAFSDEKFELHLQPQYDQNLTARSVEALIRLRDSDGNLIPPSQFIPLAEELHLIQAVGRWVASESCRILKRWENDPILADIDLAINISGSHFSETDFIEEMREILSTHNIDPARLKIELTESTVVANINASVARIQELQKVGICLAMDDFGTGHSSLSYLRRLPFDQIKIDRSFVGSMLENRNDMFIVQSVLTMAHMLDAEVIAEGVETRAQFDSLREMGCNGFQGYFFCKPLPIPECEQFLRTCQQHEIIEARKPPAISAIP